MRGNRKRIRTLEIEKEVLLVFWHDALQGLEELRRENMEIRLRAEQMALAIEDNDWDLDSALRLADVVSAWREFQERACTCPACEAESVFAEEEEEPYGLD